MSSTATANGKTALFDPAEVERTLELLLPAGQVTELRALEATSNGDRWPATYTGYFAERDKLLKSLGTINSAKGVYIIPNPVEPALIARAHNRIRKASKGDSTSDNHITRRAWLLVDCDDAMRPAGVSATDAEHKAAVKRAREIADDLHFNYGWPDPIMADSGNGGHLQYRIDEPADDAGLVERCLQALSAKFTDASVKVDTTVHNPARIWKLYGTLACKGDSTPDRPHRMSRILSAPSQLVPVSHELLSELAGEVREAPKHETNGQPAGPAFDIDGFISRAGFDLAGPDPYQGGRRWTFNQSPLCDHHDDGPFLIQFSNGALSAGCHHDSCGWTWHDLRAKYEPKQERRGMPDLRPAEYREQPSAERRREVTYQRITSAELASGDYEVEFAIDGAMVLGQPLTIGGPMKVLKTSILIDAAVSLASGGYFLGRLKVNQPRRVLVMSGESGLATIQETARRISNAAGIELGSIGNLLWSPDIPKFNSIDHLESLEKFLRDDGIEVLFCDPAYLAMPSADAGNLMAQGELLRNVAEVCRRLGVTLVLCHHTKRNTGQDAYEPLELQHLAWAGHAEFCRQWWLVNRRERYEPGTGEHKLWLSVGGSAGHSSLWAADVSEGTLDDIGGRRWEVELFDAAGARDAAKERQQETKKQVAAERLAGDCKAVCEAAAALPLHTGTKREIRDTSGLNTNRFEPALASLIRDKTIEPTTITKGNNRKYDAYKLRVSE